MAPDIPKDIDLARAREVLGYFLRNPNAADDVEGVTRWRLRDEIVHRSVAEIAHALDWLTAAGFLLQESAAGMKPVFRLNPTRASEAERFLRLRAPVSMLRAVDSRDPATAEDALLTQALKWVDAALLRYHHTHPVDGNDVPGFTRSQSSIERALSGVVLPAAAGADEAVRAAEAAASELVASLAHGDLAHTKLATLYGALGLTPLELQALVLSLAPEIDVKYQMVYGVLHDDLGRRAATLGLICALLGESRASRTALAASGGLVRWRLLEGAPCWPCADEPLRLDPAVVAWLLGDANALVEDARLRGLIRRRPWVGAEWMHIDRQADTVESLVAGLVEPGDDAWLALAGEDSDWWRATLEAVAERLAIPLVRVSLAAAQRLENVDADDLGVRIARATQLTGSVPVVNAGDARPEDCARMLESLATTTRPPVLIASDPQSWIHAWPRRRGRLLHRTPVDSDGRGGVLVAAAEGVGLSLRLEDAEHTMATFPLGLDAIDQAVRAAALRGAGRDPKQQLQALVGACRHVAAPGLSRFARRLQPTFCLDDVVLPADRRAQLEEVVAHVVHAPTVLRTWGFGEQLPYGRGVAALFTGASGTGKTMAVQAIAYHLQREIFVVDLSQCVSKYIGESEKHLDVVFGEAERAGAVLHFEEADALFGRRSEVKDAHDRYANIEVAYLLQRMEAYKGLAILTTNLRQNLDSAFLRRLRFVVDFPKPDVAAREEIWRKCLPSGAPVAADVDIRFLARRFELTGGHIRQITLRAAFAAARDGHGAIAMHHVVGATRAELLKLGMPTAERELAELASARWAVPRAA